MPSAKNLGPLITSKYRGGVDDFPKEFLAFIGIDVLWRHVPTDVDTDPITGLLIESKIEQDRTNERKKTNTFFTEFPDTPLISYVKLDSGLVGTRVRLLTPDPTTLTINGLTESADQHNLGNGWLDETVVQAPELFEHKIYSQERKIVTPDDFSALLQITGFTETEDGVASDPGTLADGQISVTDEEIDVFHHRLTTREIDILDLPKTIHNRRTNQFKQVVDVFRTLDLASVTPTDPSATVDTTFTRLGDGTSLEVREQIDEVFDARSASIEIPDLLPDIFKAVLPIFTSEFSQAGTSINDPPSLGTGELFKSETRETEFTRKIRTRGRGDPALDTPILAKAALGGFEFGGGLINSYVKLVDVYEDPPSGLRYIGAQTVNLGDGLFSVSWDILDDMEWPELIGTEVDPRTGIAVGIKKKVVEAGTEGGVDVDGYHDVKPIDRWKSVMISSKLDPTSLPTSRTWETTIEHAFKNTLLGAEWIWAAASAPFAYDFDMTLILDIDEGYAGPCRGKVTESFTLGPPSDTISPTIFCPKGHTVGFAWAFAADPSEDCGTCIGIARAHAQTWSIPPTLHDEIEIGGAVTLVNGSFSSTLPATSPIALPTPGTLITKACDVEVWRFNVFYRRLVEIYVPDCS